MKKIGVFQRILMFLAIVLPISIAIYIFIGDGVQSTLSSFTKGKLLSNENRGEIHVNTAKFPEENFSIILVNTDNPLPSDFSPTLTEIENGNFSDETCAEDLERMLSDCRSQGLNPLICSSYRTRDEQSALFENQVNKYINDYSQEEAAILAAKVVAYPDTSEHRLGLAFDIVDVNNQLLDESQQDTPVQKWLMENCANYGFILRYPIDKSEITGVIFEPWHYRYVGIKAAQEIDSSGLCLEEYINS